MVDASWIVMILLVGSVGINAVLVFFLAKSRGKIRKDNKTGKKRDLFYLYLVAVYLVPVLISSLPKQSNWSSFLTVLPTVALFLYFYFDGE